jgi:hypothetical protein
MPYTGAIWVDFNYTGSPQKGSYVAPFNTLLQCPRQWQHLDQNCRLQPGNHDHLKTDVHPGSQWRGHYRPITGLTE